MIVCGWCHALTLPGLCIACGRDAALPWAQRGLLAPTEAQARADHARRRMAEARRELGPDATLDDIAELLGVSERTVRRRREMTG